MEQSKTGNEREKISFRYAAIAFVFVIFALAFDNFTEDEAGLWRKAIMTLVFIGLFALPCAFLILLLWNLVRRRFAKALSALLGLGAAGLIYAFAPALSYAAEYIHITLKERSYAPSIAKAVASGDGNPILFLRTSDRYAPSVSWWVYDRTGRVMERGEVSEWARKNIEEMADAEGCSIALRHIKGHFYALHESCDQ